MSLHATASKHRTGAISQTIVRVLIWIFLRYDSPMIISEPKKGLIFAITVFLFTSSLFAQGLQPAPDLLLLDSGYGAAALGMAGAFTPVATDLSAIYWNPAGAAQTNGMQFFIDYSISGDNNEDFAAEVQPDTYESPQRFALKGNQFSSFAVSYTFQTRSYRFTPLFAWHRTDYSSPRRNLKEPAGLVNFITPQVFFQSEGSFSESRKGGDEEWAFGIAAMASKDVLFGGTINFLKGSPETKLTGTFQESFINQTGTARSDLTLDQTTSEDLSGTYFKLGLLFFPQGPIRLGGNLRFPYTRSSDLTLKRSGTVTEDGVSTPLAEDARAQTQVDVPMEWSVGAAIVNAGAIISATVTYSDWSQTVQSVSGSSNTLLIPETSLLYPVLRAGAVQNSLLQYRLGTEYVPSKKGTGLMMRAGYLWDGQPYGNGERRYFKGYTFGAGFLTRSFRIDGAYMKESGDARLTSFSSGDSSLSVRRFLISLSLLSQ